jgi:hypothetical protein
MRTYIKPTSAWAIVDKDDKIKECLGELEIHTDFESLTNAMKSYRIAGEENLRIIKVIVKEVK